MSETSTPYLPSGAADRDAGGQAGTAPMEPAKTPVGSGAVSAIGLILALVVTALGIVAVRDALVAAGVLDATLWLEEAVSPLDGLRPGGWAIPIGLVLVALGLWLLIAALRPRSPTVVALQAQTGVFLRPRDVGRLATTAAEQVDGVLGIKVKASRRNVAVTATTTGDEGIRDRVHQVVSERLAALASPPTIRVRTTTHGGDR